MTILNVRANRSLTNRFFAAAQNAPEGTVILNEVKNLQNDSPLIVIQVIVIQAGAHRSPYVIEARPENDNNLRLPSIAE